MLIHPSILLFFFIIVFSNLNIMSSNSFFFSWILLEINLMAFIPLIMNSKNKYASEAALKYFLIQAITSMVLLFSIFTLKNFSLYFNLNVLLFALMMKMGTAPCHQWMPPVAESLNWFNLLIFFSLQKINPLMLLLSIIQKTTSYFLLILYILSSAVVGALGGLTQNSLKKILTYSSIAHMAWLLVSFSLSNWLWIFYFFVYCLILTSIILIFHQTQMSKISHMYNKTKTLTNLMISTAFLSLGGLPPFSGFLPKFFVTQELYYHSFTLLILLLSSTFMSLFFYIRMFIPNILFMNTTHKPLLLAPLNKQFFLFTMFVNTSALLIIPFFFTYS